MNKLVCCFLVLGFVCYAFSFNNYMYNGNRNYEADIANIAALGSNSAISTRFADSEAIGFCNKLNSNEIDFDYFMMQLNEPENAYNVSYAPFFATVCTICFDGDKLWAIEGSGYRLISIDYHTGEYNVYGFTHHFTVIDYSVSERKLYAVTLYGAIYEIDMLTYETQYVSSIGGMIAGGCIGNDNMLYCIQAESGDYIRVDLHSGEYDLLFNTGQQYNHPMGFSCDRYTGLIYWMDLYQSSFSRSILKSYDPENGEQELIGYLPETATCSALCIPSWNAEFGTPKTVSSYSWTSDNGITINWTNPVETVNGEVLNEVSGISIYRNDELLDTMSGTVPGQEIEFYDSQAEDGSNIYTIIVENAVGEGAAQDIFTWNGLDQPGRIDDVIIFRQNETININWQPPAAGMHGGQWYGNVAEYEIAFNNGAQLVVDGEMNQCSYMPDFTEMLTAEIRAVNEIGEGLTANTIWIDNTSANPIYSGNYETPYISNVLPFNSYYLNAISESLYSSSYIRESGISTGAINAVSYEISDTDLYGSVSDIEYQFFIGETDKDDLFDEWILAEDLELVYEGFPEFTETAESVMIEFDAPYIYTGRNLVILIHRKRSEDLFLTYSSVTDFYESPGCSRNINNSDHWLCEFNLVSPWETEALSIAPNIRLHHAGSSSCCLSGTITDGLSEEPLSEAEIGIRFEDSYFSAYTDFNGCYYFPNIMPGTYEVIINHPGYRYYSELIDLTGSSLTADIEIIPADLIDVSGVVVSNTGDVINQAQVTLSGNMTDTAFSDENGIFLFENVWGYNDYTISARDSAYISLPVTFSADSTDLFLGNIILPEQTYRVENQQAVINTSRNVEVTWTAPDTLKLLSEDFDFTDGGFQSDYGWDWGSDSLVAGLYGENLWGTALNNRYGFYVDYRLDSPEIFIDSDDYYLSFSMYLMSGAGAGGNVKVSADRGETWSVITPDEGYDDEMFYENNCNYGQQVFTGCLYYWTEYNFDLSSFADQSIIIRFQFGTTYSHVINLGWYIDNVQIERSIDRRDFQSYRVIKGMDLNNYSSWDVIAAGLTETAFIDTSWLNNSYNGLYTYAIQVEYDDGVLSAPAFCDPLSFGESYTINFNIVPDQGQVMQTEIDLLPINGFYNYSADFNELSTQINNIWNGEYQIIVNSLGYNTFQDTVCFIEDTFLDIDLEYFLFPPDSISIDEETGFITWNSPSIACDSYKIYLGDMQILTSDSLAADLCGLPCFEYSEEYQIGISALYNFLDSEIIYTDFTCWFNETSNHGNNVIDCSALISAYPNPFNPLVNFAYQIKDNTNVNVSVYNIKGQKVKTILDEVQQHGSYNVAWSAESYSSGVYFVRFKTEDAEQINKILLLK